MIFIEYLYGNSWCLVCGVCGVCAVCAVCVRCVRCVRCVEKMICDKATQTENDNIPYVVAQLRRELTGAIQEKNEVVKSLTSSNMNINKLREAIRTLQISHLAATRQLRAKIAELEEKVNSLNK